MEQKTGFPELGFNLSIPLPHRVLYGYPVKDFILWKNVSLLYGYKLEELFLQVEYLVKNKRHFQIKTSVRGWEVENLHCFPCVFITLEPK